MYLTILLLPFLGSLYGGLRGRAIGTIGSQIVTTGCIFITTILSFVAFYEVGLSGTPVVINIGTWIESEPLYVNWAFLFDDLTVSILMPVLIVSSLVHLYSMSYMADDPHNQRFFSYLSFFTASMVVLVTGDSYLVLFLGWEGIGIASFLLIGFWLTRVQANKSAVKALTVNRVGDASLSVGLFALLWTCGSLEYASVYSVTPFLNETAVTVITLLLFGGAMSKSAQIPLHTWLPDSLYKIVKWIIIFFTAGVGEKNENTTVVKMEETAKESGKTPFSNFTIQEMYDVIMFLEYLKIVSLLVALIYIGPLSLRQNKKGKSGISGQIKLSDSFYSESTVIWLVSILSPLITKPVYTKKEETDKRDGSKWTYYTIRLKTHPILYDLWTVFYQITPNGDCIRALTRANLAHLNPIVLCVISLFSLYKYNILPESRRVFPPSHYFKLTQAFKITHYKYFVSLIVSNGIPIKLSWSSYRSEIATKYIPVIVDVNLHHLERVVSPYYFWYKPRKK